MVNLSVWMLDELVLFHIDHIQGLLTHFNLNGKVVEVTADILYVKNNNNRSQCGQGQSE